MKIGYYVQGTTDEAFVHGLADRWCANAERAPGKFRGSSRISFRRELANALWDLRDDKHCDVLVVLTDSDVNPWREVKRREWERVSRFVANAPLKTWIKGAESFEDFYEDARRLATQMSCSIPNELDAA